MITLKRFAIESSEATAAIDNAHEITTKIALDVSAAKHVYFSKVLKENAEPPIKGEITASKIKWRGIKMRQENTITSHRCWLEQRGKIIGEPFVVDYSNWHKR
jgi:hypothetical protein